MYVFLQGRSLSGILNQPRGQRCLWESEKGNEPEVWKVGGPAEGEQYIWARSIYVQHFAVSLRKFMDPKLSNSNQNIDWLLHLQKTALHKVCPTKLGMTITWRGKYLHREWVWETLGLKWFFNFQKFFSKLTFTAPPWKDVCEAVS